MADVELTEMPVVVDEEITSPEIKLVEDETISTTEGIASVTTQITKNKNMVTIDEYQLNTTEDYKESTSENVNTFTSEEQVILVAQNGSSECNSRFKVYKRQLLLYTQLKLNKITGFL